MLNEKDLSHLVTALEVETFRAGDCIIRQGQAGDSFFIIKEGEVAVHKLPTGSSSSTELGLGPVVATLGPGRYFGEKAILQEDVRQASCIAVGSVTCLSMSREMFIRLVGSWRDLAEGGQAQAAAASSQDESAAQANGDGAASSDGPAGASTSFSVASLADVEVNSIPSLFFCFVFLFSIYFFLLLLNIFLVHFLSSKNNTNIDFYFCGVWCVVFMLAR